MSWAVDVEAKSRRGAARQFFQMAHNELDFAGQQGDRYHFLRVGGGVSGSLSLDRLFTPVRLWRQQAVHVCVVL
jgi:hypothetical protein